MTHGNVPWESACKLFNLGIHAGHINLSVKDASNVLRSILCKQRSKSNIRFGIFQSQCRINDLTKRFMHLSLEESHIRTFSIREDDGNVSLKSSNFQFGKLYTHVNRTKLNLSITKQRYRKSIRKDGKYYVSSDNRWLIALSVIMLSPKKEDISRYFQSHAPSWKHACKVIECVPFNKSPRDLNMMLVALCYRFSKWKVLLIFFHRMNRYRSSVQKLDTYFLDSIVRSLMCLCIRGKMLPQHLTPCLSYLGLNYSSMIEKGVDMEGLKKVPPSFQVLVHLLILKNKYRVKKSLLSSDFYESLNIHLSENLSMFDRIALRQCIFFPEIPLQTSLEFANRRLIEAQIRRVLKMVKPTQIQESVNTVPPISKHNQALFLLHCSSYRYVNSLARPLIYGPSLQRAISIPD